MSRRSDTRRSDVTRSYFKLVFLTALVLLVVPWTRTSSTSHNTTSPSQGSVILGVSPREQATGDEVKTAFGELPERGKLFFKCSRKRAVKAGQWDDEDDELMPCQKQNEAMSLTRGSSEGTCGGSYQLDEGAQVMVRLPSVSPICDMLFTAVGNVTLVWHCPTLTLASHQKEYLFFSTGDTLGRVHYASDSFSRIKGLTQLYLLYTRTRKKLLEDSNIVCLVKAGDKTGLEEGDKQEGEKGLFLHAKGTQTSNCSLKCGMAPKISGMTRIFGGTNATEGEYPWMAAVRMEQKTGSVTYKTYCGGSILTNKVILTAAHCLRNPRNLQRFKTTTITAAAAPPHHHHHDYQHSQPHSSTFKVAVMVGVLNKNQGEKQAIPVERYIIHPELDASYVKNDVALLFLAKEVEWKEGVGPICLAPPKNHVGEMAIITGWGITTQLLYKHNPPSSELPLPAILQEATVKVLPRTSCVKALEKIPGMQMYDKDICAAFPGKGACLGDSGGPLIVFDGGIWYLLGVATRAIGCGDPAYPFLFANVSSYIPWILSHISGSC